MEVEVEKLELLPLALGDGAPELRRRAGVGSNDELEDAMAGRAEKMQKQSLASHATCMLGNSFTCLMHVQ